ncbi:hypothetical protein BGZ95_007055, partial [Linnemannia exigua]
EEEAAKKKAEEEEAAKRAAEEEAKRKAKEDEAARRKAEEEEAARKKAEEEDAVRKKADEEEAARKKAEEEEAARKKAEEEEAARKKTEEEEAAKKSQEVEREAARKAAEDAEAARKAKEEADRKAAVEEASRKAREEAEKNKNKDQDNKETSKDSENGFGDNDGGISDPFDDHMMIGNDKTSEATKKAIMIGSIAGGAALVAIVVVGFLIRHKRDASRRASAMEAYLSKKVELQPMGGPDNNQSFTSFSRNSSNNNRGGHVSRGGSSGQDVYSHRSNSRHARSQQHLMHPSPHLTHTSPRHQHAAQHYDDLHYDDPNMNLPTMPSLMSAGAGPPSGGAGISDQYYPQYHCDSYRAISPVLVSNRLAPQDQYDQYDQYYQQQGHDYYNQYQQEYDGYYDRDMYSSGIATDTTVRPAPTFINFPLPPVLLAIDTASKGLSTGTDATATAATASPNPATLTSPLPRDPHALTYSGSTASSSTASFAMSSASTGTKNAKGSLKRSPVAALIASETDGDVGGSQEPGGHRTLRRSGSVLFG